MTKDDAEATIRQEIATARHAQRTGNDGMVRVCARRAAGAAIRYWLQTHPHLNYKVDALSQLKAVSQDASHPDGIRSAAQRLTARVTEQFTAPFSSDPVEDSTIIINYFLENA